MNSDSVVLRRAGTADALPAADVWLHSFAAALPSVRCAHDEAEVRDWFLRVLVPQYETWVAVRENSVVGLMVLNGPELEQLYLDPAWRGRGLGDRFVAMAKQQQPDGLALWTFQVNEAARRFYERHVASPRSSEQTGIATTSESRTSATFGSPRSNSGRGEC